MSVMEVRIGIAKNKLGDFVEDLANKISYAKILGISVVVPSNRSRLADPGNQELKAITDDSQGKMSRHQEKVLDAIRDGIQNNEDLAKATGVVRVTRIINILKKKKLVKGRDGSYAVL